MSVLFGIISLYGDSSLILSRTGLVFNFMDNGDMFYKYEKNGNVEF